MVLARETSYKPRGVQCTSMDPETNVGGRDRIARALLAVVLSVVAVRALRKGKRATGLLAVVGALGFGFNATTCFCGMNKALGIDTTDE